ncbi:MAG: hypothetical protein Q8M20_14975 [Rhodocyclaceae bacterium]|nr:hypothetical protein [Rhodocyclaceae bacterium]MDZ4215191.1 hypothetical protein [Rhodocyclaceae bacterium]
MVKEMADERHDSEELVLGKNKSASGKLLAVLAKVGYPARPYHLGMKDRCHPANCCRTMLPAAGHLTGSSTSKPALRVLIFRESFRH